MEHPRLRFWEYRLNDLKTRLASNNFEVWIAADAADAGKIVRQRLLPQLHPRSISWGGSMTFIASGLYAALADRQDVTVIDTFEKGLAPSESNERRRQSLLVDLFITGSNAVTEDGRLVNLDMLGNRVAALTFGPKNVIVMVGRNKIVGTLEDAMQRIRFYAAPANAIRLDKNTPCFNTGRCQDCNTTDRICNTWTITEKSYPKGRVKIILINEDLGL